MMKLLIIDDDRGVSLALAQALGSTYEVDLAATGGAGVKNASHINYNFIVLDLHLPDMSGLAVCEQLRSNGITCPILVLSGESKPISKVTLLDAGADDYLTKPFSLGELKARLRVLQRRANQATPIVAKQLKIGELQLNNVTHEVIRDGKTIALRRKEFALLECLMQHAGTVVTREILTHHAWRENEDPWTNTIDVHIKYLRDKIDRPFARPLIKTVHGLGYKLENYQPVAKL